MVYGILDQFETRNYAADYFTNGETAGPVMGNFEFARSRVGVPYGSSHDHAPISKTGKGARGQPASVAISVVETFEKSQRQCGKNCFQIACCVLWLFKSYFLFSEHIFEMVSILL